MSVKIAAIADIHYKSELPFPSNSPRKYAIADILLLRAVKRLNRYIRPDITIILGDLLDDGACPNADKDCARLKEILELLDSPVIILPGNHDKDIEEFYRRFPRPNQITDIKDVRFVTFWDEDRPGCQSHRSKSGMEVMSAARRGHSGPIVSLQHVPLFPQGKSNCPYHLLNSEEAWGIFKDTGYTLSLSGHHHEGDNLAQRGDAAAVIVPALCESPFAFTEIIIDGENVDTKTHQLKLPQGAEFVDYHVHTPLAYCQENMNPATTIELAREFGLGAFSFTEHSGQLHFDRETYWDMSFLSEGINATRGRSERIEDYFTMIKPFSPPAITGLEIDCDWNGNPVVLPGEMERAQVLVGAVHWLQEIMKPNPSAQAAGEETLRLLTRFLTCGVHILAHPFRLFLIKNMRIPYEIIPQLVSLLKENNVAAELNFHNIDEPQPEFVQACVESGVKLVFGSDSHNLYEIGEFFPHIEFMKRCGYTLSDLPEIMARPEKEL